MADARARWRRCAACASTEWAWPWLISEPATPRSSTSAKLPVSQLKIDKSFVIGMARPRGGGRECSCAPLPTSGHHLGLQVVAEGVEDRPTFDKLGTFSGCDAAQGYYMARPMTAADLAMWLRQSSGASPAPT